MHLSTLKGSGHPKNEDVSLSYLIVFQTFGLIILKKEHPRGTFFLLPSICFQFILLFLDAVCTEREKKRTWIVVAEEVERNGEEL